MIQFIALICVGIAVNFIVSHQYALGAFLLFLPISALLIVAGVTQNLSFLTFSLVSDETMKRWYSWGVFFPVNLIYIQCVVSGAALIILPLFLFMSFIK